MGPIVRGRVACLRLGGGSCAATSLTRTAVQANFRLPDDWTELLIADQKIFCDFDLLPIRIAMVAVTKPEQADKATITNAPCSLIHDQTYE